MDIPRCIKEGYIYINEKDEWSIKEDAPQWAKEEFEEHQKMVNPKPDENGIVTNY